MAPSAVFDTIGILVGVLPARATLGFSVTTGRPEDLPPDGRTALCVLANELAVGAIKEDVLFLTLCPLAPSLAACALLIEAFEVEEPVARVLAILRLVPIDDTAVRGPEVRLLLVPIEEAPAMELFREFTRNPAVPVPTEGPILELAVPMRLPFLEDTEELGPCD